MAMREQAEDKKDAAWLLSDAFLDGLYDELVFDSRFDRGMAVMVLVARFVCLEQMTPESYLEWLAKKVRESIVAVTPEEAAAIGEEHERRKRTCH
jgi:hypothetical protein